MMAKRVKTNYDRGYVNAMDKILSLIHISGAGSIAAYSVGITDIDPIRYNLIFERFLNPERVSMPDFDVDFCYERRQDRKSTRLNSSHITRSRMPSSA